MLISKDDQLFTNTTTGSVLSSDSMRKAHPNTIFPVPFEPVDGYVLLEETLPSYDPETQKLSFSSHATESSGIWSRTIIVVDLTPEEIVEMKKERVPYSVTRRQARRALALSGLLDLVQPAIDAIPDPTARALAQIDWDDAQEFQCHDETLLLLASALELTEDQLDDLFILAGEQP